MSTDEQLEEAHRRVWDLVKEMDDDGIPAGHIIDALMGIGLNAHNRISGPQVLAGILRRAADSIESGRMFTGDTN